MPSLIADSAAVRTQIYALRLQANPAEPTAVGGQIEHVISGRCLSFDSAAALLAGILQLQRQALVGTGAVAGSAAPD
jgi:hypothetical protein